MVLATDPLPLSVDADGIIRIGGTRVTLDTLVSLYEEGYPAEWLAEAFPSLTLADIHAVVGYFLRHRNELEEYLKRNRKLAERNRQELESKHPSLRSLKSRLLARRAALDAGSTWDQILASERQGTS